MPILTCPLHPIKEKDEAGVARALTPTKAIPVPTAAQNPEGLVLPGNEENTGSISVIFQHSSPSLSFFLSLYVYTYVYNISVHS